MFTLYTSWVLLILGCGCTLGSRCKIPLTRRREIWRMGKSAIKREAGYGRLCGDKGGLLTGPQSKENNWNWNWQNQGSVGVCVRKYILTTVSTTVPAKCVLIQRIKSYSMSLTMPSFLTCFFLFMATLWNRETIYIFMLWFVLSFFLLLLLFFSSPNLSRRRLDVCHTSTHGI